MQPNKIKLLLQAALSNIQTGQSIKAQNVLNEVLQLDSHNQTALHWLGIIEGQLGNLPRSLQLLEKLIALKPSDPEMYYNLATTKMNLKLYDEAAQLCLQAIKLNPRFVKPYINLGHMAQEQDNLLLAEQYLQKALSLDPHNLLALYNLGTTLQRLDKISDSIIYLEKALALQATYLDARLALSKSYILNDNTDKALQQLHYALAVQPDNAEIFFMLGEVLRDKEIYAQACEAYKKAIELDPSFRGAHINLGFCLQALEKFPEAQASYTRALALEEDPEIHTNYAQTLLHSGDLENGFIKYEARIKIPKHAAFFSYFQAKPRWEGEIFSGRRLLVHYEQGFGDIFQFVRYLPLVKARGGIVLFAAKKPLLRILETVAGIDYAVDADLITPDAFDLSVPLMSLPRIFGTTLKTIPAPIPYIKPNLELTTAWQDKLSNIDNMKVGLVWAGNPKNRQGLKRSCHLTALAKILSSLDNITYFSLQLGKTAAQINEVTGYLTILDYTDQIEDFADTAALIANLDLIISVDTAVAHLAGAIGKPVWLLLPYANEWRWLSDRQDTPWYPTMKLFRQPTPGDWQTPLQQIITQFHS